MPNTDKAGLTATHWCGTLSYTRSQLAFLFLMLLGGDFAFTFFEQIFGRVIPLLAKDFHGSNTLIGIMTGSLAGLMNLFVLPNISVDSDRRRGPLGRRIPYLLWSTPFTVASLLLVGFAPEIGRCLHDSTFFGSYAGETSLVLGLLCVFAASYHLGNMVLSNVYTWLIRDVVPPEVIGRFFSWFRVVSTVAAFGFLNWVFPSVMENRRLVFVIVGGVYLVIFLVMCWQVREGQYPPPPPKPAQSLLKTFGCYFRDCLSVGLYRDYFVTFVLMTAALTSMGPFGLLFARETLGLSMEDIGRVAAYGTLVGALIMIPMGWVSDRFKPVWLLTAGLLGFIMITAAAFFLLHDRTGWWVYSLLNAVPWCAWGLGSTALTMELFPREEFGQFSAGLNVFGYGALIVGNYLAGTLMDAVGSRYKFAFVWTGVLTGVALIFMSRVIRGWRAHGGPHDYKPPLPIAAGLRFPNGGPHAGPPAH